MITLKEVVKTFDNYTAINRLNLNVKKGSIYGLVGVNGSGKTTCIKHLAGLYRQDEGLVLIDGENVHNNRNLKERMGYIPDELYFFNQYTMKRLAKFYANMYPKWNEERFTRLTDTLKLPNLPIKRFSKGMQKQAAFVFVMSIMPDFLLLDEPIDGLDPIVRKTIFKEIIEDVTERSTTVLVSSHNLKEMDDICDAIGIIKQGHMVIEKDLDDLKSNIHKIQVAFKDEVDLAAIGLNILSSERVGSVSLIIVKGEENDIFETIKTAEPLIYDRLPLTLEEVFVYETEAANEII